MRAVYGFRQACNVKCSRVTLAGRIWESSEDVLGEEPDRLVRPLMRFEAVISAISRWRRRTTDDVVRTADVAQDGVRRFRPYLPGPAMS